MFADIPSISYTWSQLRHLGGLIRQASAEVMLGEHKISLISVLPEFVPKHWRFFEHAHAYYEAHIILAGEAKYSMDGTQALRPGSSFIHPPMTPHSWETHDSTCTDVILCLTVEPAISARIPQQWPISQEISWQLAFLLQEAEDGLPGWPDRVHGNLIALLSRLLLVIGWPEQSIGEDICSPEPAARFPGEIQQFLLENFKYPLTLNDIAKAAGMSRRTFSRHFRQTTGYTVFDYLGKMRMNAAKSLLRDTGLRVSEIGERIGIPETSCFCRRFRSATGMTPQQYRQTTGKPE